MERDLSATTFSRMAKLLNYSINLDMNDTKATFLHQEDKNEKINTEEVYFSKLSFFRAWSECFYILE